MPYLRVTVSLMEALDVTCAVQKVEARTITRVEAPVVKKKGVALFGDTQTT